MSMKNGTVVLIVFALLMSCATAAPAPPQRVTALVGGRVLPSPQAAAIADGVVLVEGAAITAVGPRASVRVPEGATVIDYSSGVVTAGFWNSHVHFTGPQFRGTDTAAADALAAALRAMLTSYGVVHVVDTGSLLTNTLALRVGSKAMTFQDRRF
jgi:imidazolonepropionase-like amidohydrolase